MPKPIDVEVLRCQDVEVLDVDQATSLRLIVEYHYAKGGPNTGVYRHGLFFKGDPVCVGVAHWLPPTKVCAESVVRGTDRDWRRVLSLSRLAISPAVPQNAASLLIGASLRRIRSEGKWMSLVTYADESQGHSGAIYRATNWEYIGITKPETIWVDADGRMVAKKSASKSRTQEEMRALGYRIKGKFKKHKFRMLL
jgi:hypothetical protein